MIDQSKEDERQYQGKLHDLITRKAKSAQNLAKLQGLLQRKEYKLRLKKWEIQKAIVTNTHAVDLISEDLTMMKKVLEQVKHTVYWHNHVQMRKYKGFIFERWRDARLLVTGTCISVDYSKESNPAEGQYNRSPFSSSPSVETGKFMRTSSIVSAASVPIAIQQPSANIDSHGVGWHDGPIRRRLRNMSKQASSSSTSSSLFNSHRTSSKRLMIPLNRVVSLRINKVIGDNGLEHDITLVYFDEPPASNNDTNRLKSTSGRTTSMLSTSCPSDYPSPLQSSTNDSSAYRTRSRSGDTNARDSFNHLEAHHGHYPGSISSTTSGFPSSSSSAIKTHTLHLRQTNTGANSTQQNHHSNSNGSRGSGGSTVDSLAYVLKSLQPEIEVQCFLNGQVTGFNDPTLTHHYYLLDDIYDHLVRDDDDFAITRDLLLHPFGFLSNRSSFSGEFPGAISGPGGRARRATIDATFSLESNLSSHLLSNENDESSAVTDTGSTAIISSSLALQSHEHDAPFSSSDQNSPMEMSALTMRSSGLSNLLRATNQTNRSSMSAGGYSGMSGLTSLESVSTLTSAMQRRHMTPMNLDGIDEEDGCVDNQLMQLLDGHESTQSDVRRLSRDALAGVSSSAATASRSARNSRAQDDSALPPMLSQTLRQERSQQVSAQLQRREQSSAAFQQLSTSLDGRASLSSAYSDSALFLHTSNPRQMNRNSGARSIHQTNVEDGPGTSQEATTRHSFTPGSTAYCSTNHRQPYSRLPPSNRPRFGMLLLREDSTRSFPLQIKAIETLTLGRSTASTKAREDVDNLGEEEEEETPWYRSPIVHVEMARNVDYVALLRRWQELTRRLRDTVQSALHVAITVREETQQEYEYLFSLRMLAGNPPQAPTSVFMQGTNNNIQNPGSSSLASSSHEHHHGSLERAVSLLGMYQEHIDRVMQREDSSHHLQSSYHHSANNSLQNTQILLSSLSAASDNHNTSMSHNGNGSSKHRTRQSPAPTKAWGTISSAKRSQPPPVQQQQQHQQFLHQPPVSNASHPTHLTNSQSNKNSYSNHLFSPMKATNNRLPSLQPTENSISASNSGKYSQQPTPGSAGSFSEAQNLVHFLIQQQQPQQPSSNNSTPFINEHNASPRTSAATTPASDATPAMLRLSPWKLSRLSRSLSNGTSSQQQPQEGEPVDTYVQRLVFDEDTPPSAPYQPKPPQSPLFTPQMKHRHTQDDEDVRFSVQSAQSVTSYMMPLSGEERMSSTSVSSHLRSSFQRQQSPHRLNNMQSTHNSHNFFRSSSQQHRFSLHSVDGDNVAEAEEDALHGRTRQNKQHQLQQPIEGMMSWRSRLGPPPAAYRRYFEK